MHDTRTRTQWHEFYSPQQDRGHSDPYTPFPAVKSGNDDAEDLSPRASKPFSDLFASETALEPGNAAPPRNKSTVPSITEAQVVSVLTLFPRGIASFEVLKDADVAQSKPGWLKPVAQKQPFFKKHYRRLKDIHDEGPPGEAQLFLAGMNSYWKERKATVEFEMYSRRLKDEANPKPLSESTGQQRHAGQTLRQSHGMTDRHKPRTRKDSAVSYGNISCSSQEVPVKLWRTVLEMNTNKPLPPMPPLQATPRGRAMYINKLLPRLPRDCSSGPEKQGGAYPSLLPPTGKSAPSKAEKAHDALKAKISRPVPITRTVNNHPPDPAPALSEKAKGKPNTPSSPTWLDRLAHPTLPAIPTMPAMPTFGKPKKRPASDESFTCQGLREGNVFVEMIMGGGALSAGTARPVKSVDETSIDMPEINLVPEPLFTGRGGDGSPWGGGDAEAELRSSARWV
ncbi:uncharacterized protein M421DRAFT_4027 [Didymella exigua CBS 183.55]|uniref:Uncharacterized protein n=1 Tax=Didymella exigua CBS 183.55 TaxID=1150837 RepID=A0A6A5RQW5_9PLEO|nr:uncharacterized protein M421DRAFT_4027 [Didymella exigua CBS 183.55]KAF1929558.1 hypothetical protein M421DRAFT_4027 [Didymella exigua CBS 183.55]